MICLLVATQEKKMMGAQGLICLVLEPKVLRVVLAPWISLCSIGGAAFPLPCHSATCIVARFYLASGLEQSESGYLLDISWLSRPRISWQLGFEG